MTTLAIEFVVEYKLRSITVEELRAITIKIDLVETISVLAANREIVGDVIRDIESGTV